MKTQLKSAAVYVGLVLMVLVGLSMSSLAASPIIVQHSPALGEELRIDSPIVIVVMLR